MKRTGSLTAAVIISVIISLSGQVTAFHHVTPLTSRRIAAAQIQLHSTRRSFVESFAAVGILPLGFAFPQPASASGGATAGGAYLLSAKQRYNDRVKAGIKGFVALGPAIEAGDLDAIRPYFAQDEPGNWKDVSTAGYLLANAFRRNSTAAPDSLPSVKKWKAFAAQVEALTKALKSKNSAAAQSSYQSALVVLDEYLALVDLPVAKEF